MPELPPYDVRANWDATRQVEEVAGLFAGHAGSLVRCIDDIYRPALETMEARANEYADLNNSQAKRIAELEALRDSLVGIALQVAALPLLTEMDAEDGRTEAVDDVIHHARDTLDDFVLVPTGSL